MRGKDKGLLSAILRPRWPWVAGLIALAVYAMTVSRGVYPGQSALLMACAANLLPDGLPTHPVWSWLTGGLTHWPLFSMALRLNLFSALCAAVTAGLLGLLMERWLFQTACDPLDGTIQPMRPEDEEAPVVGPSASPVTLINNSAVIAHNRRAATAARVGGWVAAWALAFSVPFWSAATRLHFLTFDLMLLSTAVYAVQAHSVKPSLFRALAVALLCGLGCVESAIFVPWSPLLFLWMLRNRLRFSKPWRWQMLASLLMAMVGALAGLLLLWNLRLEGGRTLSFWTVLAEMLRAHFALFRQALPATGWVWLLLLGFMPAGIMLLAAKRAFSERSFSIVGMHVALTAAVVLCLANASISPWGLVRNLDQLPVMASLATAVVAGYLAAFWRMLMAPLDRPDDVPGEPTGLSVCWSGRLGVFFCWMLTAEMVVAAWLNLGVADGRKGAFADDLARDVLARLGARTWVVSSGLLDKHLLVMAHEQQRTLQLVSLVEGLDEVRQRHLRALVDAEPDFAVRRVRLYNAIALGPMAFIQEWLAGDPAAETHLMVVGVPEIWTMAGYRAVPAGLGFNGTRSLDTLRGADLVGVNRDYWRRTAKMLASDDVMPAGLARFRAVLRREAGLSANNLGVVLEDLSRPTEAYEAYEAAYLIDPCNLSALLNQHALTLGGIRADTRLALERKIIKRLQREKQPPPFQVIVHSYGDIRQPQIISRYGLIWAEIGQSALACAELKRALAMTPTNSSLNNQLANLALRQDNTAESEQACRAVLAGKPNDATALTGLAAVALARGRHDEARIWLERARQAGASEVALAIPEITLLIASGRTDTALARLRALTEDNAANLEAWALQADLLLRAKNFDEVEQRVLPAMSKAAGKHDHVLVHLVRANLLSAKRPVDFVAARMSLLRALKLRPDLMAIRDDLLQLDFAFGDQITCERDAVNVLRMAPEHAMANYLFAKVLFERGELRRAEDLFRRSVSARPTARAYNDLAETLRRLRQFAAAEQAVRAALEFNVKSYAAWDTLGCVLLDAGRLDEAAQAVTQSLKLCATDPRIHLTLARVRLAQERRDEVRDILRRPILESARLPPDLQREVADLSVQLN